MDTAEKLINILKLQPHPEGGFYKETYRSTFHISEDAYKFSFEDKRSLSTVIYFLLKSGQVSKFHKLKFDEIWFYHSGCPLLIHMIDETGNYSVVRLGMNPDNGEMPQFLVPANVIFGSEPAEVNSFSLVSCMVSPGFDFRDFHLYNEKELTELFPQHKSVINRLNG